MVIAFEFLINLVRVMNNEVLQMKIDTPHLNYIIYFKVEMKIPLSYESDTLF